MYKNRYHSILNIFANLQIGFGLVFIIGQVKEAIIYCPKYTVPIVASLQRA